MRAAALIYPDAVRWGHPKRGVILSGIMLSGLIRSIECRNNCSNDSGKDSDAKEDQRDGC